MPKYRVTTDKGTYEITTEDAPSTVFGLDKATGIGPEPGMLERMGNAVGPSIRGAGDVTGANWLLESSGLVDPGRLTGDETTARDAGTRRAVGAGGAAMMLGQTGQAIADVAKRGGARAAAAAAGSGILIPQAKYWAIKVALIKAGIPPWMAETAAVAASGYRARGPVEPVPSETPPEPTPAPPPAPVESPREVTRRLRAENRARHAATAPAPAAETPAPSGAAATVPQAGVMPSDNRMTELVQKLGGRQGVTPPPEAAPVAAPSAPAAAASAPPAPSATGRAVPHPEGGVWSPTRIASEVGIQARRQGLKLTTAEDATAQALVRDHGALPKDAVATVVAARQAPAQSSVPPPPARAQLSPEEQFAYAQAIQLGKTPEQAMQGIQAARALAAKPGMTSGTTAIDRVLNRNTTGRWDEQ